MSRQQLRSLEAREWWERKQWAGPRELNIRRVESKKRVGLQGHRHMKVTVQTAHRKAVRHTENADPTRIRGGRDYRG